MPKIRLQKILSRAGVASLRQAEKMITAGRVEVDGAVVTRLGTKVDSDVSQIKIDGREISSASKKVYFLLNKPTGYLTTRFDPKSRPTIMDLIKEINFSVYPVGRLDFDTEGLLLLTNDGDLTFKLTHPKFEIEKEYLVEVEGILKDIEIKKIQTGIELEDGPTAPAKISGLTINKGKTKFFLTIHEGKKRQIRRMTEVLGHLVVFLRRIRIGPIRLGDLASGTFRPLEEAEIKAIRIYVAQKETEVKEKKCSRPRKKHPVK